MNKLIKSLLVAGGIVLGAQAQAGDIMSIPPAQGLTTCSAVFSTLAVFAKNPDNKDYWSQLGFRTEQAAERYNPNAMNESFAIAKIYVAKVRADDREFAGKMETIVPNCKTYVTKYGVGI